KKKKGNLRISRDNIFLKKINSNKLEHFKVEVISSTPLSNEAYELCKRSGASVELEISFAMKCYVNHIGMNAELNHKYYTLLQQVCYHNVVISNTTNAQFHICAMSTRKTLPDILQLLSKTAMLNNNNNKNLDRSYDKADLKNLCGYSVALLSGEWTNDNRGFVVMVQWVNTPFRRWKRCWCNLRY
ncbi:hypothetical protein RFI_33135, partial [Reticulomyxa filosa]